MVNRGTFASALTTLAAVTAIGCLALAALAAFNAWRATLANRDIAAGKAPPGAPVLVLFARAHALQRDRRWDEALSTYSEVEAIASPEVAHAARFNASNIYLRRAIAVALEEGSPEKAITLVEIAKSGYRHVLRERPDEWNARYNLELAQRLVPDYEVRNWRRSGSEAEVEEALKRDKSAWTEMIGTPRGMH
ncbi:MAG: hypothetical protein JNL68_05695 [Burkholderiales bacterium]|nr:hypothetical protein [Burkholderiales bacterium]